MFSCEQERSQYVSTCDVEDKTGRKLWNDGCRLCFETEQKKCMTLKLQEEEGDMHVVTKVTSANQPL